VNLLTLQVEFFWVVTPCRIDGGSMDLRNVGTLPTTKLHGVPTQKNSTWIFTAVKSSNLATVSLGLVAREQKIKFEANDMKPVACESYVSRRTS